ncbi:MAG: DoxX family protein [Planctomycetes bacterium]|nr:DoxX family protein [Planctomycetota bacterium]
MAQNLTKLFARIIVCMVFLPAGIHAIFGHDRFTTDEAQRIEAMGSPAEAFEKVVERAKPASLRAPRADDADGTSKLRALNRLALRLQDARVPQPLLVAWAVSCVELVGGAAVLLGFFTRLFALPLAVIGAFHLWKVVWPQLGTAMAWNWSPDESHVATTWVAATLLPLSLFMLGAGAPSVDSLMKGSGGKGGKKAAAKPAAAE